MWRLPTGASLVKSERKKKGWKRKKRRRSPLLVMALRFSFHCVPRAFGLWQSFVRCVLVLWPNSGYSSCVNLGCFWDNSHTTRGLRIRGRFSFLLFASVSGSLVLEATSGKMVVYSPSLARQWIHAPASVYEADAEFHALLWTRGHSHQSLPVSVRMRTRIFGSAGR